MVSPKFMEKWDTISSELDACFATFWLLHQPIVFSDS